MACAGSAGQSRSQAGAPGPKVEVSGGPVEGRGPHISQARAAPAQVTLGLVAAREVELGQKW